MAVIPSTAPETKGLGLREGLLVALTFSSGAVDAICFLALGKVFTAFMTGNFVFLGLLVSGATGPDLLSVLISLGAFSGGVFLATQVVRKTQGSGVWPREVTLALALSVAAHAGFLAFWLTVGGHPSLGSARGLLGISAVAMGIQTGAVFSLGVQGVFTTAATATTTVLMGDAAAWTHTAPDRRRLAAILVALLAGATAGGLLLDRAVDFAPVLPLVVTSLVLATAALAQRRRSFSTEATVARQRDSGPIRASAGAS